MDKAGFAGRAGTGDGDYQQAVVEAMNEAWLVGTVPDQRDPKSKSLV